MSIIHLSADPMDLSCPVCYCAFGRRESQPISTNCGHTLCSNCFGKLTKCPLCTVKFDKTKMHHKSILLSSLIANSTKGHICKEHSNICQGICRKDRVFVCFDCLAKNHQGHKIITMSDLNDKTKKITKNIQNIREKQETQLDLKEMLEVYNNFSKRTIDQISDEEIVKLKLIQKRLQKIYIQKFSEKDQNEQRLLSEDLSKYCNNSVKVLEDWNKNQEVDLAIQIMDDINEEIPETQMNIESNCCKPQC